MKYYAWLVLLMIVASGCASQKPLPFAYSISQAVPAGAPSLTIRAAQSERVKKDDMDEALALPACLDPVMVKELEGCGLFSAVTLQTNGIPRSGYVLESSLKELRWEVPDYDKKVGTAFAVSLLTGGIGGIAYGSTSTEVLGHVAIHFHLTDAEGKQVLLDHDYAATANEKKAKMKCDSPGTYREMAAKAFKMVLDQFENDLRHSGLK